MQIVNYIADAPETPVSQWDVVAVQYADGTIDVGYMEYDGTLNDIVRTLSGAATNAYLICKKLGADEMTLQEYDERAAGTAIYPGQGFTEGLIYATLGLTGEAGESSENVKKLLRDDGGILTSSRRDALMKEAGDVLWYLSAMAAELGSSLEEIAQLNLNKLADRKARDVLGGSGDNR